MRSRGAALALVPETDGRGAVLNFVVHAGAGRAICGDRGRDESSCLAGREKIIHMLAPPGFIVVWKRQEIVINVNALLWNTSQSTWEYQMLSSESTQRKVSCFCLFLGATREADSGGRFFISNPQAF